MTAKNERQTTSPTDFLNVMVLSLWLLFFDGFFPTMPKPVHFDFHTLVKPSIPCELTVNKLKYIKYPQSVKKKMVERKPRVAWLSEARPCSALPAESMGTCQGHFFLDARW